MFVPNEIKEEYQRKRQKALSESEEKKRAVYLLAPRLEEIAEKRRGLLFDMGVKLIKAKDKEAVRFETAKKVAELDMESAAILAQNGITADYFLPQFECMECEDTGFTGDMEKKMCTCLKQRLLSMQYASSCISEKESFENFDLSVFKKAKQRQLMATVKAEMESYCEAFPHNEKTDILLMGNSGLGKTFMLSCVAKRLTDKGFSVLKLTSYNLINTVLKSMRGSEFDFMSPDLLIIDDLGTEPMIPNVTREHLFAVINERQNASKATAIATNLLPEELQEVYGERLFSRIFAPRITSIIMLTGDNVRMVMK
ncbi:MAG: ATP-binding protein [Clostridia bacterium]|nr:ATP-binding protein [Clostridia bacterium]